MPPEPEPGQFPVHTVDGAQVLRLGQDLIVNVAQDNHRLLRPPPGHHRATRSNRISDPRSTGLVQRRSV